MNTDVVEGSVLLTMSTAKTAIMIGYTNQIIDCVCLFSVCLVGIYDIGSQVETFSWKFNQSIQFISQGFSVGEALEMDD